MNAKTENITCVQLLKKVNIFSNKLPQLIVLACWVLWHIKFLWVISCQNLFMYIYIYQIYMNCKHIICSLTFLDKPELTCLHKVILGATLANTSTSI